MPAAARPAPFGGFAPPSLDMSAEAIYARATAAMEADAAAAVSFDHASVIQTSDDDVRAGIGPDRREVHATPDHATQRPVSHRSCSSTTSTPEDSDDDSNERSSALRRLIGSLRRKDR